MTLRILVPAMLGVLLFSCSPVVRVYAHFFLPSGMNVDAARLHVLVSASERPDSTPEPVPIEELEQALVREIREAEADRLDLHLTLAQPRAYIVLSAWFDANGNGRLDEGDAVGRLEPAPQYVENRGCGGNELEVSVNLIRQDSIPEQSVSAEPPPDASSSPVEQAPRPVLPPLEQA